MTSLNIWWPTSPGSTSTTPSTSRPSSCRRARAPRSPAATSPSAALRRRRSSRSRRPRRPPPRQRGRLRPWRVRHLQPKGLRRRRERPRHLPRTPRRRRRRARRSRAARRVLAACRGSVLMLLFVGLGNPGANYARHRHNFGFMAVGAIARSQKAERWRERFHSATTEVSFDSGRTLLLLPQTFMNDSGRAVQDAMRFYKVELPDVVVFHDELDLAPG